MVIVGGVKVDAQSPTFTPPTSTNTPTVTVTPTVTPTFTRTWTPNIQYKQFFQKNQGRQGDLRGFRYWIPCETTTGVSSKIPIEAGHKTMAVVITAGTATYSSSCDVVPGVTEALIPSTSASDSKEFDMWCAGGVYFPVTACTGCEVCGFVGSDKAR
jgi:hypothetical protein